MVQVSSITPIILIYHLLFVVCRSKPGIPVGLEARLFVQHRVPVKNKANLIGWQVRGDKVRSCRSKVEGGRNGNCRFPEGPLRIFSRFGYVILPFKRPCLDHESDHCECPKCDGMIGKPNVES